METLQTFYDLDLIIPAIQGIIFGKFFNMMLLGRFEMKDLSLLVWLTQLGLSVAAPLAGFVFLGVWLHQQFSWGSWVIWAGVGLGVITAISGFSSSLKAMKQMQSEKPKDPPTVSFNEHH